MLYYTGQRYSEVTSQCKKCNSQATDSGGYLSIPEADIVVERPKLVYNVRFPPPSCCKTAFACILLHLRAGRKAKMPAYVRESCEGKNPTQAVVQRLANEQSSYACVALGPFRGAVCWRLLSLSPLSPFPSFHFSLSSPPPLSVLFSKTNLGKRAPGKQPHRWYGGHLGSICGLWTRVKHFCCTKKPRNLSSGEAKMQKPTKSTEFR